MANSPRPMGMLRSLSLALMFLIGLTNCGYKLGYVKPAKFASVTTIYVPTFKNETLEPRSAVFVTNAVIQQFQRDGTYSIGSANRSDAILEASIVELNRRQTRSARFNTLRTSELEFTLVVAFKLRSRRTGEILDEGQVEGEVSQFLDPNFQLSERQALPHVAERLAESLVSRLGEGW